jgi:hypothetical protein
VQGVNERSLGMSRLVKENYGIVGRIELLKILVSMMERTLNVNVETLSVLMKTSGLNSNNILLLLQEQKHNINFSYVFKFNT